VLLKALLDLLLRLGLDGIQGRVDLLREFTYIAHLNVPSRC
jgi:hypothetical protein